jgi:hypothetical protein
VGPIGPLAADIVLTFGVRVYASWLTKKPHDAEMAAEEAAAAKVLEDIEPGGLIPD